MWFTFCYIVTMYTIDYYFTLYTVYMGVQWTGTWGFRFAQGSQWVAAILKLRLSTQCLQGQAAVVHPTRWFLKLLIFPILSTFFIILHEILNAFHDVCCFWGCWRPTNADAVATNPRPWRPWRKAGGQTMAAVVKIAWQFVSWPSHEPIASIALLLSDLHKDAMQDTSDDV